ncbi:peroxiredoxin [Aliishimia ponticola]|uniref:Glutathione-dependent peroxiredoxin n=1 Tax=Aliishimia ponticola TaxID=2499833 RepID=A0A4S4NC76_9RHOB|nr:peroxiredoxin [Aliishimia ponticola]THH37012.1 peroxiredoxin [Aliishimia ponticola]
MAISTGDTIPEATLVRMGAEGPEQVSITERLKGRKVIVFGLPGAFTSTCSASHVPSFIRTKAQFDEKGVDEIICVSVNDPFVMQAWEKDTGAGDAGLTMLADPAGEFTKAMGRGFDAPPVGFYGRSQRYAMYVVDGKVEIMQDGDAPGQCDMSSGEAMLEKI